MISYPTVDNMSHIKIGTTHNDQLSYRRQYPTVDNMSHIKIGTTHNDQLSYRRQYESH